MSLHPGSEKIGRSGLMLPRRLCDNFVCGVLLDVRRNIPKGFRSGVRFARL